MKKNRNKKTIGANFWQKLSVETRWFVVLASLFGIIFILTTLAFTGFDEGEHYKRVWQITDGIIFSDKGTVENGAYGGYFPINLFSAGTRPAETKEWYSCVGATAYSPISYIPSATGMFLAKSFNAEIQTIFYLSRLFGLLFFIAGIAFALNALRGTRAQWLVFVVALLPSTLFQAFIITADTTTNVFTIILSALLIKSLFLNKNLSRRESIMLLVSAALIPLLKQSYALLSLLIFLVPLANFGIKRPRLAQILALSVGFSLFIGWSIAIRDVANYIGIRRGELYLQIEPSEQIQFLLHHPFDTVKIALNTLLTNGQSYLVGFFGNLTAKPSITLATSSMLLCILMLGLSVFVFEKTKIPRRYSLIILADVLIMVLMIFALLYLTFTPVGSNIVDGVQGRYFIPFAILALSAVSVLMHQFKPEDISDKMHTSISKLFLYGTTMSLFLTAFKSVYTVAVLVDYKLEFLRHLF